MSQHLAVYVSDNQSPSNRKQLGSNKGIVSNLAQSIHYLHASHKIFNQGINVFSVQHNKPCHHRLCQNVKSVTWITKIYNKFELSRFISFGI